MFLLENVKLTAHFCKQPTPTVINCQYFDGGQTQYKNKHPNPGRSSDRVSEANEERVSRAFLSESVECPSRSRRRSQTLLKLKSYLLCFLSSQILLIFEMICLFASLKRSCVHSLWEFIYTYIMFF